MAAHDPGAGADTSQLLIERLAEFGVDPGVLAKRLVEEKNTSARFALILALGRYSPERLPDLVPVLGDLYDKDCDAGIHGASGWLLRKWKEVERLDKIDEELATGRPEGDRSWYVDKGHAAFTILRLPAARELATGSTRPRVAAEHRFAISACEVTDDQFKRLRREHRSDPRYCPEPSCPVSLVTMSDAAEYCNWLSKEADLPEDQWCYQRAPNAAGFVAKPDFASRIGYRLPTEEEWRFAASGQTSMDRYYGEGEDLAGYYAWYFANSNERSMPVGMLKPNEFGLLMYSGMSQNSARPRRTLAGRNGTEERCCGAVRFCNGFPRYASIALGSGFVTDDFRRISSREILGLKVCRGGGSQGGFGRIAYFSEGIRHG